MTPNLSMTEAFVKHAWLTIANCAQLVKQKNVIYVKMDIPDQVKGYVSLTVQMSKVAYVALEKFRLIQQLVLLAQLTIVCFVATITLPNAISANKVLPWLVMVQLAKPVQLNSVKYVKHLQHVLSVWRGIDSKVKNANSTLHAWRLKFSMELIDVCVHWKHMDLIVILVLITVLFVQLQPVKIAILDIIY